MPYYLLKNFPLVCRETDAWRPVALTPIFSKCFEKIIKDYICSVLPASLELLQFAYRSHHSTNDAIAFTLHTALSQLKNKTTYVRELFVDYNSAFNTIVPATLVAKLQTLGLNRSLCSWIQDFLTGRSQVVRMGNNTSSPLVLNTGAPQGCVLSPLLYSLYTHDCTATHSSNVIIKFADDTTVIGLITDNNETAYREEVSTLLVSGEPSLTQHRQDQGAGGGFQETEQRTHTHRHRQDTCGVGKQL